MTGEQRTTKPRIPLVIDFYCCIQAAEFDFNIEDDGDYGARVKREDGSWQEYSASTPTNREYFGLDFPVYADASLAELRTQVVEDTDWPEGNGPLWAEFDNDGEVDPTTDTEARFSSWLDKQIDDDLVEQWLESTWGLDEYAPGFDLVDHLPSDECQALGLLEVNIGGPANSVWAIKTTAGIDELNAVLAQHQAPFVFVGDERAS